MHLELKVAVSIALSAREASVLHVVAAEVASGGSKGRATTTASHDEIQQTSAKFAGMLEQVTVVQSAIREIREAHGIES
jgi:hypothetical protein